jgi:O-antigen/teichoic acid export membrane protein
MGLYKSFSVYFCGKIIRGVSTGYLIPLFTFNLTPAEFGSVGILWILRPMIKKIIDFGMQSAYSIKYHKVNYKKKCSYLYNSLLFTCFNSMLIFILLNVFTNSIRLYVINVSRLFLNIFLCVIVLDILQMYFVVIVKHENNPKYYVIFDALKPFITAVVTTVLFLVIDKDFRFYILGMLISNIIITPVVFIYLFINYIPANFNFSLATIIDLIKIGFPLIPSAIGSVLLSSGDRYIIKLTLGLEAVGIYTLGYKLSHYANQLLFEPFIRAYLPIAYSKTAKKMEEGEEYIVKKIYSSMGLFILFISIAMIMGRDIIYYLGGEGYINNGSLEVYLISLTGIFILHLSKMIGFLINFVEKTHISALINVCCAVFNISLNYYFVPKYGIEAAAIITVVSYFLLFSSNYFITKILCNVNLNFFYIILSLIGVTLFSLIILIFNNLYISFSYYIWCFFVFILFALINWRANDQFRVLIYHGIAKFKKTA